MPRTKQLKVAYVVTIIVASSILLRAQATPAANDGTSTGQRIGNIVSAAVSTAFPAVSKVMDAIWPNKSTNSVKPAEAKAAITDAKDKAAKAQQTNVDGLSAAAKNLAVLRSFVTECGFGSIQLTAMQQILAGRNNTQPLSTPEKQTLQDLWTPTGDRLKSLTTDAIGKSIDGMKDNYLQATLSAIREAINNNSGNIKNQIDQGRASDLVGSVSKLASQINGIGPLTGLLIGDLSASLSSAADNIAGHAGTAKQDIEGVKDRQRNLDALKKTYPTHIK